MGPTMFLSCQWLLLLLMATKSFPLSEAHPLGTGRKTNLTFTSDEVQAIIDTVVNTSDNKTLVTNGDLRWTFTATAEEECIPEALYCIPVETFKETLDSSKFLDTFNETLDSSNFEGGNKSIREEMLVNHAKALKIDSIKGLGETIARALAARTEEFRNKKYISVEVEGSENIEDSGVKVEMFAIGAVVSDIRDIDYEGGLFNVDLRLYMSRVTFADKEPSYSLRNAMDDAWTSEPESTVGYAKNTKEGLEMAYPAMLADQLDKLDEETREKKDEELNMKRDGRCNDKALANLEPVKKEEYEKLSNGLHILRSVPKPSTKIKPVTDVHGNILYLQANNVDIKFEPVNSEFYPFQVNILDIAIMAPPSRVWNPRVGSVNLYSFCINEPFTGFNYPLPGLPSEGSLDLVPTVKAIRTAPWFNKGHPQLFRHTGTSSNEIDQGEKIYQGANFRIIYRDEQTVKTLMLLLPFFFASLVTFLQWWSTVPEKYDGSSMINSVLLSQGLVMGATPDLGNKNIAKNIVYWTYWILFAYVSTVAAMALINIKRPSGKWPWQWLSRHQLRIYKYMRLVLGNFMILSYFIILWRETNKETGEQTSDEKELITWIFVGIFACILAGMLFWDYRSWKHDREENWRRDIDYQRLDLNLTFLKVDEVRTWIATSTRLQEASKFSKDDLVSMSNKFYNAKVDGGCLLELGSDPTMLTQHVGLAIGDALNFRKAFDSVRKSSIAAKWVERDEEVTALSMSATAASGSSRRFLHQIEENTVPNSAGMASCRSDNTREIHQ